MPFGKEGVCASACAPLPCFWLSATRRATRHRLCARAHPLRICPPPLRAPPPPRALVPARVCGAHPPPPLARPARRRHSGNVIALDILRALRTEPHAASALLAELDSCRGADSRLDALSAELAAAFGAPGGPPEGAARRLCDQLAVALQAAALLQHGNAAAATAYCASRLPAAAHSPGGGWNFGSYGVEEALGQGDVGGAAAADELLRRLTPSEW